MTSWVSISLSYDCQADTGNRFQYILCLDINRRVGNMMNSVEVKTENVQMYKHKLGYIRRNV